MPSALDFITSALKASGVIAEGETPTSEAAADGLVRLNDMIDGWGTQRLTVYAILRTVKALTSGTASYTLGTGGDINIARPTWIDHAGAIADSAAAVPFEEPLQLFTDQAWAQIPDKTLAGQPAGIYYDHTFTAGLGRVSLYPVPNTSTSQLVLYTPQAITEFADLSTAYTFPPGYKKAIRRNLTIELSEEFGREITPAQRDAAMQSLADVKRGNLRLEDLRLDSALSGRRRYDLNADWWLR